MLGAITGAAVKIIVMSDIRRAASLPLAMSRTIARVNTMAEAAPKPCRKRAASSRPMLSAADAMTAPMTNSVIPTYRIGRRPSRSENSPAGIWPQAMPAMKMPTICWPRGKLVASASTMAGMAGRLTSTVSAARPVNRPSVTMKLGFRTRGGGLTISSD